MAFSRQEYWSGFPCPCPGALPNPRIEPTYLLSLALAGGFFTTSTTWEATSLRVPGESDENRYIVMHNVRTIHWPHMHISISEAANTMSPSLFQSTKICPHIHTGQVLLHIRFFTMPTQFNIPWLPKQHSIKSFVALLFKRKKEKERKSPDAVCVLIQKCSFLILFEEFLVSY